MLFKMALLTLKSIIVFVHYLCMVTILFNTDLNNSASPTYSFKKLVFRLSLFCTFCLF